MIVKIMVELLSVLALATQQIEQGRFSESVVTYSIACGSLYHREVREEADGGERDRGSSREIGSIDPGRGPDDCGTDLGCGPWSCG